MFAKDDIDFIRKRLEGTIIMHNDEPVYVNMIARHAGDIAVTVTRLCDDEQSLVMLDDLDFRPVSLGYINRPRSGASWLARAPIRAWQQGLSQANVTSTGGGVDVWDNRRYLRDTIVGKYPTLIEASKSKVKKAFSKDFAVEGNEIHYKDRDVIGVYEKDKIVLKDRYIYLSEYIQEVVG
jgi:hypothetical protein